MEHWTVPTYPFCNKHYYSPRFDFFLGKLIIRKTFLGMLKSHFSYIEEYPGAANEQTEYMWQKLVLLSENCFKPILNCKVLFTLQTINGVLYSAFYFQCIAEVPVAKLRVYVVGVKSYQVHANGS